LWGLEAADVKGESQASGSSTSISLVPYTEMMEVDTGEQVWGGGMRVPFGGLLGFKYL